MSSKAWCGGSAVVAVLCLVAGCTTSEGSGEGVARGDLAGRVARIYCESLGACCASASVSFDAQHCVQYQTAPLASYLAQFNSAAVKYDGAAASRCLAQLEVATTCGEGVIDGFTSCAGIFRGTVEELEPCGASAECKQTEGQRSTCQMPPGEPSFCLSESVTEARHGIEGGDCYRSCDSPETCSAETGQNIACFRSDGLFCAGSLPFGTCRRLGAIGAACDSFAGVRACSDGSFCDSVSGTCMAAHGAGEECFGDEWCQSGKCTLGGQTCSPNQLDPVECQR